VPRTEGRGFAHPVIEIARRRMELRSFLGGCLIDMRQEDIQFGCDLAFCFMRTGQGAEQYDAEALAKSVLETITKALDFVGRGEEKITLRAPVIYAAAEKPLEPVNPLAGSGFEAERSGLTKQ
jgi:hypothetical protein